MSSKKKEDNARLQRLYRAYLTRQAQEAQGNTRFDLTLLYPETADVETLLEQVDDLKKCLDSFRPLDSDQANRIDQDLTYQYTYDSNRIEGNTLTLRETTLILEKGVTIAGKSLREHLEVTNHAHAFDFIKEIAQGDVELDEYVLRQLHQLVLAGIEPRHTGTYRPFDVSIAGSQHVPPPHYLVPQQMEQYIAFYQQHQQTQHPVLLASDMHEKLVTIHPFVDGNGRMARLVMNLILLKRGYPLANISGDTQSRMEYYEALETVNRLHQSERFYRLVAHAVKQSALWYLQLISTVEDPAKGEYFFSRIAPYLKGSQKNSS